MWWWPHPTFVVACEPPVEVHEAAQRAPGTQSPFGGRLHHEHGPAVRWADGWALWVLHGTRVPPEVVEAPASLTVERIATEVDVEVRRVMIERFGADRFMGETDATLVDDDPEWGRLWRCELSGDEPTVMVECVDATPGPDDVARAYWLRVPPDTRTARAALAWTFGMESADQYAPGVQT